MWTGKTKSGRRKQTPQDEIKAAGLSPSGGGGLASHIRPKGRAPRGQGGEYAARRSIANKIEAQDRNRQALQRTRNNYRGTKAGRWQDTRAQSRIQELTKAIDAALNIANSPGDWGFKKELIDGLFDYVSVTTGTGTGGL